MPLSRLEASVQALQALGEAPPTGIVLGSGQGGLVDRMEITARVAYADLGFPSPGVKGHAGELVLGTLAGARVAVLSGRVHAYEGGPISEVVHAARAMARWGISRMVLTCSVGAVDPSLAPGQPLVVEDHINFSGRNALVGEVAHSLGERFLDVSDLYSRALRADAVAAAEALGFELRGGTLACMLGPSYETPAEIRMLGWVGVHVVGMSTVHEVLALAQLGVPSLVFALVTNAAAGLGAEPLDHADVVEVAGKAGERMGDLITATVKGWA
jgi:purine-nucleoside phosphorylase